MNRKIFLIQAFVYIGFIFVTLPEWTMAVTHGTHSESKMKLDFDLKSELDCIEFNLNLESSGQLLIELQWYGNAEAVKIEMLNLDLAPQTGEIPLLEDAGSAFTGQVAVRPGEAGKWGILLKSRNGAAQGSVSIKSQDVRMALLKTEVFKLPSFEPKAAKLLALYFYYIERALNGIGGSKLDQLMRRNIYNTSTQMTEFYKNALARYKSVPFERKVISGYEPAVLKRLTNFSVSLKANEISNLVNQIFNAFPQDSFRPLSRTAQLSSSNDFASSSGSTSWGFRMDWSRIICHKQTTWEVGPDEAMAFFSALSTEIQATAKLIDLPKECQDEFSKVVRFEDLSELSTACQDCLAYNVKVTDYWINRTDKFPMYAGDKQPKEPASFKLTPDESGFYIVNVPSYQLEDGIVTITIPAHSVTAFLLELDSDLNIQQIETILAQSVSDFVGLLHAFDAKLLYLGIVGGAISGAQLGGFWGGVFGAAIGGLITYFIGPDYIGQSDFIFTQYAYRINDGDFVSYFVGNKEINQRGMYTGFSSDYELKFNLLQVSTPRPAMIPSNLTYTNSADWITFQWTSGGDKISDYHLQVGTTPGAKNIYNHWMGDDINQITINVAPYNKHGQSFYARVRGKSNDGTIWDWSENSYGITIDLTPPVMDLPPIDTRRFTRFSEITVTWPAATDPESGIVGYQVQAGTGPGGNNIYDDLVTGLSATITCAHGQTVFTRVRAKNGAGSFSAWFPLCNGIIIDLTPPVIQAAPLDTGQYTSSTNVRFHWPSAIDEESGVVDYHLQVGTKAGGNDVFDGWIGNVLAKTITGKHGQTFYARICAKNGAGAECEWSASSDGIKIDTTPPPVIAAPIDKGQYTDSTIVKFSWNPAADPESGITDYHLKIGTTPGGNEIFDNWVGNAVAKTDTGAHGETLYAQVRSKNGAGLVSDWSAVSDGITIVYPPVDVEAEMMQDRSDLFGRPDEQGWVFTHENHPIWADVEFKMSGPYYFRITAKGESDGGAAPWMQIKLGDFFTGCCEVAHAEWHAYSFYTHVPEGTHSLSVDFLNDWWNPYRGDRNLYLDKLNIAFLINQIYDSTMVFEAENMSHQHPRNFQKDGAMVLHRPYSYISHDLYFGQKQDLIVDIYAKGDFVNEGWPSMNFLIGKKVIASFTVNHSEMMPYQVKLESFNPGKYLFKIAYAHESWAYERNLYIDKIIIPTPQGALLKPEPAPFYAEKEIPEQLPETFAVGQNYPNPFNPVTSIAYQLPEATFVRIKILNTLGQEVKTLVNESMPAGFHTVTWNGLDENNNQIVSGIYLYRIEAGNFVETKKMILLR